MTNKFNLNYISERLKKNFNKKYLSFNHAPTLTNNDYLILKKCIKSEYISSVGRYVDNFENEINKYTGAKYTVCTVNGTSSLHIALKVVGVKENDEIIMPSLSFVAPANASKYLNATPNFVDISLDDLSICPKKLYKYLSSISQTKNGFTYNKITKKRISAIVLVHVYGLPSNSLAIKKIANKFNIKLVEDAAEGLGSFSKNRHVGTIGDIGILSFNGNKIISTGGGGAILTNNINYARKAKYLTTVAKAKNKFRFIHTEVGFNYRMPNINAALGCSQIKNLNLLIKKKLKIHEKYKEIFEKDHNFILLNTKNENKSNYWLNTIILKKANKKHIDLITKFFDKQGIAVRPCWNLLSSLPYLKNSPKDDLSNSIKMANSIINLPSSPSLIK